MNERKVIQIYLDGEDLDDYNMFVAKRKREQGQTALFAVKDIILKAIRKELKAPERLEIIE